LLHFALTNAFQNRLMVLVGIVFVSLGYLLVIARDQVCTAYHQQLELFVSSVSNM